jgi:hypothetical protein
MSMRSKYLEALKTFDDWVIVSEWAQRFGELYPDLLAKAEREAENQANETTGLREIAARISSVISNGAYKNQIEIDTSERPRKVRYIPEELRDEHDAQDIEEDVEPLRRGEIIKRDLNEWHQKDQYRNDEFENISKQLKAFLGIEFEVDHAAALLNSDNPGKHHPDNFQLLLKAHNARKKNDNWPRFTFDEQTEYIHAAIRLQLIVAPKLNIEMDESVIDSLLERLSKVFSVT